MIAYVEEFTILDCPYGIEDYADGKPKNDHFMPSDFKAGKRKRFNCWTGGCGIGSFDTIEEARLRLVAHAQNALDQKEREARSDIYDVEEGRRDLGKMFATPKSGDSTVMHVVDTSAPMTGDSPDQLMPGRAMTADEIESIFASLDAINRRMTDESEESLPPLRLRASWKHTIHGGGMKHGEIVGYIAEGGRASAIIRENKRLTTVYIADIVETKFIK